MLKHLAVTLPVYWSWPCKGQNWLNWHLQLINLLDESDPCKFLQFNQAFDLFKQELCLTKNIHPSFSIRSTTEKHPKSFHAKVLQKSSAWGSLHPPCGMQLLSVPAQLKTHVDFKNTESTGHCYNPHKLQHHQSNMNLQDPSSSCDLFCNTQDDLAIPSSLAVHCSSQIHPYLQWKLSAEGLQSHF